MYQNLPLIHVVESSQNDEYKCKFCLVGDAQLHLPAITHVTAGGADGILSESSTRPGTPIDLTQSDEDPQIIPVDTIDISITTPGSQSLHASSGRMLVPLSVPVDQNESNSSPSNTNIKLSEIRAKETRLSKWEKELKIKEAKLEDVVKEKLKLETYAKKMENKVNELGKTITTLNSRIDNLDDNRSAGDCCEPKVNVESHAPGAVNPEFYTNFNTLHNRISSLVFTQISKQLDNIEKSFDNSGPTPVRNSDPSQSTTVKDTVQINDSMPFLGNPIYFQAEAVTAPYQANHTSQGHQPTHWVQSATAHQQSQTQPMSRQCSQQVPAMTSHAGSLPLPNLNHPPPVYVPPQLRHPHRAGSGQVRPRQQYGPPPPPTLQAANNTPDVHPRRQSGPLLHPTPQTVKDTPSRPPPTLSRASNAPEVHPRRQSTPPPPPNLQTVNVTPDQRPNDHPFREPSLQSTHL